MSTVNMRTRSFWLKYFATFCLCFVVSGLCQVPSKIAQWEYQFVSKPGNVWLALAIMAVISLIIAFYWEGRRRDEPVNKWFECIIIFYVAYAISMYGFAKLLGTQFHPPLSVLDTPIGQLGGFWLTWVYYSHSAPLIYILGIMQVGGSMLLMFRRTRLPAVFLLLPVMLNIDLINQFYDISPLAYYNSAHYTFILVFLLFVDYEKLKIVFSYRGTMPLNFSASLLMVARIIVITAAFFSIYSLKHGFQKMTKLNGSWRVQSIARNRVVTTPTEFQDSVWSLVYFEWRYGCLFKYNSYKNEDKDMYGNYVQDEKQQNVLVTFEGNNHSIDSTRFHYDLLNDSSLILTGKYKNDNLVLKLKRVK